VLEVRDLVKRFGGLTAVDGCTLALGRGRITGLIGPNGAGKTTLFNMIAGALRPTAGRILFEGEDVTGLPAHALFGRGIVRTFQIPREFASLSARENLMVVPAAQPGEDLATVWLSPGKIAAREAAIRERADDTLAFLKLDRVASERAGTLSGGQKKLLELGRAMMADPRIVLLDEPGAGVNPTLLGDLAGMIERLAETRGYTFCIVEHNMDMIARLCDPVIVIAEGRVLMQGPMETVRRDPAVVEAYLGGSVAP